jgi:hypothetical protein
MYIKFISLFYANSLLHVSALLGHPEGDSQVVHYTTAVDGCPIVAGILVVPTPNLCMCVCYWLVEIWLQPAKSTHAHTYTQIPSMDN